MGLETDQQFSKWARQIRASDEEAFAELFHAVFPRMVKFAWRYTRGKPSATDIVQEVFVKLWEVRAAINPEQSLKSYLYQMVRNRALNYIRDRKPVYRSLDDVAPQKMQSVETIPEFEFKTDDYDQQMARWISELPERQREAIELSRYEGLEHEEIAEVMQISPRTVNNHIVAALKTLRNEWDAYKSEHNE